MRRKVPLHLIAASILVAAACGSARVIQRTLTGGVIELSGDQGKAMEDANSQMAAHCGPNNFTIVNEGNEPVTDPRVDASAQDHTSNSATTTDQTTVGQTRTHTATRWRVHYQCNGAAGS